MDTAESTFVLANTESEKSESENAINSWRKNKGTISSI